MPETVLTNARIVLPDAVVPGAVVLADGRIAAIDTTSALPSSEDFEGDFLLPGLVELHTDHLEGHYAPRAQVRWQPATAILSHDAQLACAGVTTVCDALRIGLDEDSDMKIADMRTLADAIDAASAADRLRAEHFIHLRCEVSAPDCAPAFAALAGHPRVRLASLMDHAPGQRQFRDVESYKAFMRRHTRFSDADFERFCARRLAQSQANSARNRALIAAACAEGGIVLASHDDATEAHVAEAVRHGVSIAEFPTTMEAADASRAGGLAILMGAPNVVRGRSHSGNVSARELAEAGRLDILSSDYIPFSLLAAAFALSGPSDEGLAAAIALVSRNPAAAAGFADRGEIAVGRRADLLRVRLDDGVPVVRAVWRMGRRVA